MVWRAGSASASAGRTRPKSPLFWVEFLDAIGGFLGTVTGDVLSEFDDDAVMDDAVDGGCRCHGVLENLVPLRENQVGCDTAPAVGAGVMTVRRS